MFTILCQILSIDILYEKKVKKYMNLRKVFQKLYSTRLQSFAGYHNVVSVLGFLSKPAPFINM